MRRGISYHRHQRWVHINRRLRIAQKYWKWDYLQWQEPGHLDKGKIHCSCPICNGANKREVIGPSISEIRRMKPIEELET